MYALVNCDIFTGNEFLYDKAILLNGEKIESVLNYDDIPLNAKQIDLKGQTVSPGFIDVQVNGGGGVLFNDKPTVDGIKSILLAHRKYGTTNMLPTFITGSSKSMRDAANAINTCLKDNVSGVLGIHFEGPFLNVGKAGVHDKKYIREVNDDDIEIICSLERGITLLTLAPDEVGIDTIIGIKEKGILISAGHTNATYLEATTSYNSGVTCTTHLYNAMTALGSREVGVVGASLDHDKSWCGIIADGHHVDFTAVRIAHKAKKERKMFLVTDAMPPVGGNGDDFVLGDYKITVENGKCITMGDVLAGSALDMATAIRNCIQKVGITKSEALRMASTYPAEFLGINNILGHIESGYTANLAIFNNQIEVSAVVINGKYEIV